MRRILQIFVALALLVAPLGSSAVWADHHEKESSSKASSAKKAKKAKSETTSTASSPTKKSADNSKKSAAGKKEPASTTSTANKSGKESTTDSVKSSTTAATKKAKKAAPAGPVNINTASAEELQTLPNIGPKKAQAILDHRKKNGKFTAVDGLKEVPGIGDKTFVGLKQFLEL